MNQQETVYELCDQVKTLQGEIQARLAAMVCSTELRMPTSEEIQARLVAKREADGLSLRDAAKLSGTSASTLSRIERGRSFDWETGLALCQWLTGKEVTQ